MSKNGSSWSSALSRFHSAWRDGQHSVIVRLVVAPPWHFGEDVPAFRSFASQFHTNSLPKSQFVPESDPYVKIAPSVHAALLSPGVPRGPNASRKVFTTAPLGA
jgi:hypothetical protein